MASVRTPRVWIGAARFAAKRVSSSASQAHAAALSRRRRTVWKFGGSSVGSAEAIVRTSELLCANTDAGVETIAVVSAMLGVTNRLLGAAAAAAKGHTSDVAAQRGALLDLHASTARDLMVPGLDRDECISYVQSTMMRFFDDVLHEVAAKGATDAYDTDRVASVGERWSAALLTGRLRSIGRRAERFESDALIVTDDVSGNARPLLEETRVLVQAAIVPAIGAGAIAIVPGYFGASRSGKLTTLGRGGSDLSAAVLGHCVDADEVALWKVEHTIGANGWMDAWAAGWEGVVHDADPTVTIASLSYEEAAELAHFGKKVLHPDTVMPAVEKAIPIAVRNTLSPSHPGTTIQWHPPSVGVAATGSKGGSGVGHGRVQAITRVPLRAYEALRNAKLLDAGVGDAVVSEEAALVVLVGTNIMSLDGLPADVAAALRAAGIPSYAPRRVNGSRHNYTVCVPESRRVEAVKLLHERFVRPAAEAAAAAVAARSGADGGGREPVRIALGRRMAAPAHTDSEMGGSEGAGSDPRLAMASS